MQIRRQSLTIKICNKTIVSILYEGYKHCDKICYLRKKKKKNRALPEILILNVPPEVLRNIEPMT